MWSVMSKSVRVLASDSTGAAVLHVKVPFPFLVEGQALPAGEYSVQAVETHPSTLLIRGAKGMYLARSGAHDAGCGPRSGRREASADVHPGRNAIPAHGRVGIAGSRARDRAGAV